MDLGEREAGGEMEEAEGGETGVRMFVQEKTLIYMIVSYIYFYLLIS